MLLDEYTLTKFLGKGTFGEVYLTTKRDSAFLFATKRMNAELVDDPKYKKYFNNEITILRRLYHKNIIKLEALKKTMNHYYVIMEYCNGGTLTQCLEKYKNLYHRPFSEEIVQHIMRQVISAINYMHDQKIIHRDLKLDNILVKFEDVQDKNQVNLLKAEIKIIDFGFAAYKDQTGLLTTAIGSPMNMDPLILQKFNSGGRINSELGYDEKADIWSLGALCYQMFVGECAFNAYNMKELVSKIEEGTFKVPTNLSKEAISFLICMLQYNPAKRKSASELIKHAFLIKNVNDFTPVNINQVANKVSNGELKINIKDNNTICSFFNDDEEIKLNHITADLFPTETPLTESQYINPNNQNDPSMISSRPFDLERNNLEKEFTQTQSTPINGLLNNPSTPNPIMNNEVRNMQNMINMPNMQMIPNIQNITNNVAMNNGEEFMIPNEQVGLPINNINTQNLQYIPNKQNMQKSMPVNGGNELVTIVRKLENGQIVHVQISAEKLKQIQQQQLNGGNVNQIYSINQPRTPMKQINQNKVNQYPPGVFPHGPHGIIQNPHGPIQRILNQPMQPSQLNHNLQKQIPQTNNIINQKIISQNPLGAMNNPYNIASNQIPRNNNFMMNQIPPNQFPQNQILPNKMPYNQNTVNVINNQNGPIGVNRIQMNGQNIQQNTNTPIRKVITIQKKVPQQNPNLIPGQINLPGPRIQRSPPPQLSHVNTMNQPLVRMNTPQKGIINQPQIIKMQVSPINQMMPKGQINRVNISPMNGIKRIGPVNNENSILRNRQHNLSVDKSNRRIIINPGNVRPPMNNIMVQAQRNAVSPIRIATKPTFPPNRQTFFVNQF